MDWIWIVIVIIVIAVNGWKKLSEQIDAGPSKSTPPPIPPRRPRPPRARPAAVRPPRVQPKAQPREWHVDAGQLQDFIQTVTGRTVAPPPIPVAQPVQPPTPEPPPPPPTPPPTVTRTTSRASIWAEALRDKQNIRNIIIASEIIGPPKSLQF